MNIAKQLETEAQLTTDLSGIVSLYKDLAKRFPDGYLNTLVFERMRDGQNDAVVKRFFAGPFAEVRIWLPEMFGIYISRFPDHPYTYVVVDNLSDEFGKYVGHQKIEPSHAQLYRPILDALEVAVIDGTMSTPTKRSSGAAANFYKWFREKTITEPPAYMLGHFLAYEITDTLDFPDYLTAAQRIWPENTAIHEFFTQHADSGHDASFAHDLQFLFEQNRDAMIAGMGNLLEQWTMFYQGVAKEVQQ